MPGNEGKRVLIIVENLSVPFDRRVWQESKALVEAGFAVDVICPMGTKRDTEPVVEIDGVGINRYPLRAADGGPQGYAREYGLALWHTWRIARRLRKQHRYDVIHVCNPPDILFFPVLTARLRGTKFVFDHHDLVPELFESRFGSKGGVLYRLSGIAEKITFRLAHGVISTNESYRNAAIERGGKDPELVQVVRSAPDLSRFDDAKVDDSRRNGKAHLACYLGVMGPQDGVDYALRAIRHLRDERDDFHVILVGDGDAAPAMRELASELDLDDCVEFTGRVSDEEMATVLQTADVGLAPDPLNPLNDVSTMNKIMEYMALSLPIVSFDLVEARVSAGDAARYAKPNDESQFAALVGELFDDPDARAQMVEIGRERVAGELSWDQSKRHLVDFYERLLRS
ncbi:MAG: glycosyltransferase family 4 protein [Actinomycetota bacterium]